MKKPTESQWACTRDLTFYLLRCLDRGRDSAPWQPGTGTKWEEVGEYLRAVDFDEDLSAALDFTFGSALSLAQDIARAHSAAAAVQVNRPDKTTAERLAEDLEAIDAAVKQDQAFQAAAAVAGALADALRS